MGGLSCHSGSNPGADITRATVMPGKDSSYSHFHFILVKILCLDPSCCNYETDKAIEILLDRAFEKLLFTFYNVSVYYERQEDTKINWSSVCASILNDSCKHSCTVLGKSVILR